LDGRAEKPTALPTIRAEDGTLTPGTFCYELVANSYLADVK
jgi:hypothetical protein